MNFLSNYHCIHYFFTILVLIAGQPAQAQVMDVNAHLADTSPWGIAIHPHRQHEFENIDILINRIKDAGIQWTRYDIGFAHVVTAGQHMNFERFDLIVDQLHSQNIQTVAILQGFDWEISHAHPELVPLYNHPQAWENYVRATVSRYKDRIKVWEIWNEPDGGFWKPKPDAQQYVKLLKIAYTAIKEIDPDAVVMAGSLASWNHSYLRQMYDAGALGYFDCLSVHSYGPPPCDAPDKNEKVQRFFDILQENDQENIDIWLTECGGSTYCSDITRQIPDALEKSIQWSLLQLGKTNTANMKYALLTDAGNHHITSDQPTTTCSYLPGQSLNVVNYQQMQSLDPTEYPVLIASQSDKVDQAYLPLLQNYIANGGLMVTVNRIPFYYVYDQSNPDVSTLVGGTEQSHPMLHLGFDAWWRTPTTPKSSRMCNVTSAGAQAGLTQLSNVYANRYLTDANLAPGDQYIPLINATREDGSVIGGIAALYKYNAWTGGTLSFVTSLQGGYTEQQQANLLMQTYLGYQAIGVDKIFIYDLHDDGANLSESEHNYGIVRWDWSTKPAYHAYQQLTTQLGQAPQFIQAINLDHPNAHAMLYKNTNTNEQILTTWHKTGAGQMTIVTPTGSHQKQISDKPLLFPIEADKITDIQYQATP
ncbi:MAG: hypothetical protein ACF8OB_01490 [Phycisphaeraceae bacterium JB051]